MKILGIGWLGLVGDHPETRRFYATVLGLSLTDDKPAYAYFTISETAHLEILSPGTRLATRQRKGSPSVGFLVEDLDSAVQELKAAGVKLKSEIEEWHSDDEFHRWVYFEDPEGHTLLLLERHRNQLGRISDSWCV
jgi:catechol 2,3-dioxygenase-like lactoylglutathione lyase family enzyme